MLRRAPAGRLLRRGRGQMGEAAKGRWLWCEGHRDRRPSFFFRGLSARGEAWGKVPLWGRGWTLGADGSAAPPDTACLGGETVGSGADGSAAPPDTACLGGETVGLGADAVLPSGHGPPGRGDSWVGSRWRRCPSGRPAWAGRRPGWEQMAALLLQTRPAWAGGDGRVGSRWRRCLSGRPAWAGRRSGWERMAALPLTDTARLGGGRRPGREQMAVLPLRTRPAWAGEMAGRGEGRAF